ncbi:dihydrolipoamide dehydrogenase [Paenibacillus sp. UNCCL117]|uniref:dihydrolipoyl dehydrogenase n=1 Tax=unclassified Paenibacillus TaxID=185978 RepID=UPI000884F32B|nr:MULTISPECIES: dihydrolipoyl dehydrogenase [unclassified Paenibacillus]SDC37572.1 dihydrolipoamide dehydrogenase [Paenibacillus sp. cl123]SFW14670.1 dihydrolipoamide dehydrogenase [Paenibacillus sp. UNCCL117]
MSQSFDTIVLGGGIGGYTAAIRASQLGKTVAIVEQDKLGGTCLHRGCIPSKALLRSAELFALMQESGRFGIEAEAVRVDYAKVSQRKQAIVDQLYQGVQYLMKKHKITVFQGKGRIIGPSIFSPRSGTVSVEQADGEILNLLPDKLIIATGSRPRSLPGLETDGVRVLNSDEALRMERLPQSALIVGGGVIGVEWASMLSDFGVQVTIVEFAQRLLPGEDEEVSRELERILKKRGVTIRTGAAVQTESVVRQPDGVKLAVKRREELEELEAEVVLVCVGRQANIEDIGLHATDIKVENGFIKVNANMQTAESHIYAVGDCIGGLQLAHAAAHEGIAAAEHGSGQAVHRVEAHQVPRCVYSRPEIASIGLTESHAKDQGRKVKTAKLAFQGLGKAQILGETDGFVKVIADEESGDIVGVHMIGAHVTDYIAEASLAQLLQATPWEVGQTIHPHPTLSEILGEAMLAVDGKAISF